MARFVRYEPCPSCRDAGGDRRGDNLAVYSDGGSHCFSCGRHRGGRYEGPNITGSAVDERQNQSYPADFSREVPARAWEWLLQYGLGWRYWQPFVGWSEKESRLVFTVGTPATCSLGRYIGRPSTSGEKPPKKWFTYGNVHRVPVVYGADKGRSVVLVEDIVSAHKVGQITECIPLFGTKVSSSVLPCLRYLGKPVIMWLDRDQDSFSSKRAASLSMLTGLTVSYLSTPTDPKQQSLETIAGLLGENPKK